MNDRVAELAGAQFNRFARSQLVEMGLSEAWIAHRLRRRQMIAVHEGVFALPPATTHDNRGRWMAATLTHPGTRLSRVSAACCFGFLEREDPLISVTRPGNGGPREHDGLLVYRSLTLEEESFVREGIPITTVPRTLLDLATSVSERALARALREAVRLKLTTVEALADSLGRFDRRKGCKRLAVTIARYRGLPIERARSGSEVRSLELLRDAGVTLPRLNVRVAGEEADLSWPDGRLIIEIDGGPFHMDEGEDRRKEGVWRAAGWTVRRIPSDNVYNRPQDLIALAGAPHDETIVLQ